MEPTQEQIRNVDKIFEIKKYLKNRGIVSTYVEDVYIEKVIWWILKEYKIETKENPNGK